ncbi:MAG: dephospho-CoA kinase [Ignavibacteria bacterium CG2_30_36_16]|nr:MAG: dephospho-CoA kinase [Ignavibacteria bacterium CG2_30_36_16]
MSKQKIKVAITGNIGSGKSLFSNYIEDEGFVVLKADEIGKEILADDEKVKQKIIKLFGAGSYINGKPDTKYLAQNVFSNLGKVQKINSVIHPAVISIINKKMNEELNLKPVVFVEAALIYEADMEEMFDFVVLISADEKLRMERKKSSISLSEEEFLKRDHNQIPDSEKRKRADFIFENNSTMADLKAKANLLLMMLQSSAVNE